ncbi:hypothetical protein, partial [Aeromonas rivipollensis]|uniref:hypothetical protein n=1 Tax=Aeromonas rivipollensis TaxID=948519 RepID=UPI001F382EC1
LEETPLIERGFLLSEVPPNLPLLAEISSDYSLSSPVSSPVGAHDLRLPRLRLPLHLDLHSHRFSI